MRTRIYEKFVYYLKSTGTCVVVVGSCWFLYQLRQTSQILQSTVSTGVLNLEQAHAQYIYIDNPRFKDVFMFRKIDDVDSSALDNRQSFSHVIMKWWKSLNRNLAYKLVRMAQNGDKTERLKALRSLNSLKYLKDWHYRQIAQTLDGRTSLSLARMPKVDTRFFLEPPYYHVQHKLYDVIEKVHYLLLYLNSLCKNTHSCLAQFLNKKFKDSHREGFIFDYDLTSVGLTTSQTAVWDKELLKTCVEILCHHSSCEQYSKDILDGGGLPVLMIIKKIFNNNTDVCILLAKIISNISSHTEYLEDIFRSGWIGTLVEWSHSTDIRLAAPAARALANLDMDENEYVKYPKRIYLLHPLHKTQTIPKLDVVFLHGLLGGTFITWRQRDTTASPSADIDSNTMENGTDNVSAVVDDHSQEFFKDLARDLKRREWSRLGDDFEVVLDDCPENTNCESCDPYFCAGDAACMKKYECDKKCRTQCWPKDWLPEDVPSLRIIGVNYDTNLSMWTPLCPIKGVTTTMSERSKEYIKKLLMAGIGTRPMIWVCHSMGGLLVKRMLVDEWENGDKHNICKNTRGVIFFSTPHRGSRVAALTQTTRMLVWPSVEVQELREESPNLIKLHKEFLNMLKECPMEIVSFGETKPTLLTALKFPFQFVTSNSADPGVGEFFEIPQDHMSICKPANRHSFLYQKFLSMIKRHITLGEEKKFSPIMELLSFSSKLF